VSKFCQFGAYSCCCCCCYYYYYDWPPPSLLLLSIFVVQACFWEITAVYTGSHQRRTFEDKWMTGARYYTVAVLSSSQQCPSINVPICLLLCWLNFRRPTIRVECNHLHICNGSECAFYIKCHWKYIVFLLSWAAR